MLVNKMKIKYEDVYNEYELEFYRNVLEMHNDDNTIIIIIIIMITLDIIFMLREMDK
jgi:hypothetical protein